MKGSALGAFRSLCRDCFAAMFWDIFQCWNQLRKERIKWPKLKVTGIRSLESSPLSSCWPSSAGPPDGLAERLRNRPRLLHLQPNNRRPRPRQQNHLRRLHPLRRPPRQRSKGSCFVDLATGFKSAREITRADIFLSLVKKHYSPPSGRMI